MVKMGVRGQQAPLRHPDLRVLSVLQEQVHPDPLLLAPPALQGDRGLQEQVLRGLQAHQLQGHLVLLALPALPALPALLCQDPLVLPALQVQDLVARQITFMPSHQQVTISTTINLLTA